MLIRRTTDIFSQDAEMFSALSLFIFGNKRYVNVLDGSRLAFLAADEIDSALPSKWYSTQAKLEEYRQMTGVGGAWIEAGKCEKLPMEHEFYA